MWIRFSWVVRASDCQCRSRNSPGLDPSILRHSGIWGRQMKQCWIQNIGEKIHPRMQWSRNHSSLTRNWEREFRPDLLLGRLRRNRRRRRCTLKRRTRLRGNHEAAGRRRTFAPHRRSLERRRRLLHRRRAAWSRQTRRRRRISLSDRDAAGGTGSPPIVILVHVGGGVAASRRSDRFKRGEENILNGVMMVCRGRLKHRRGRFVQFTYIHSVVRGGRGALTESWTLLFTR